MPAYPPNDEFVPKFVQFAFVDLEVPFFASNCLTCSKAVVFGNSPVTGFTRLSQ